MENTNTLPEYSSPTAQPKPLTQPAVVIAGLTVMDYFRLVGLSLPVAAFVLVLAQFADVFPYFHWIVFGAVFFAQAWQIRQRADSRWQQAGVGGFITGVVLGLVWALTQFVIHPTFYGFFGIITQPVTLGVLGAAVAGGCAWLLMSERRLMIITMKK